MMIPVTLEGSPFWIYNHAHQRIQEVSSLTLLHKDRILVKNQIRTASSLFILTLQSLETECTARIKKQRPMSVGFPLGCCYHTTLCVTTVASRTEEVTCSHLHFPIEVNARLEQHNPTGSTWCANLSLLPSKQLQANLYSLCLMNSSCELICEDGEEIESNARGGLM